MKKHIRQKRLAIAGKSVLGIDPGKHTHCAVALNGENLPVGRAFRFDVSHQGFCQTLPAQLRRRLPDFGPENLVIAVETACDLWLTVAHHFHNQGYTVVLVSPLTTNQSRAVAEHDYSQSDPKDAFLVADNAQKGHYDAFQVLSPQMEAAHRLSITYQKLVNERTRLVNRLTSFMQLAFPEYPLAVGIDTKTSLYLLERYFLPEHFLNLDLESEGRALRKISRGNHGRQTLLKLRQSARTSIGVPMKHQEQAYRLSLDAWLDQLAQVQHHLERVRTALVDHTRQDPAFPILTSLPGISDNSAARFIAETRGRFTHAKQIEKLAGLSLRLRDSVKPRGPRRLSKIGNRRLGLIIYQMLHQTVRLVPNVRRRFLSRELEQPCYRKNLLAATPQLLRLLMALIKQNRPYEDRPDLWAALQPLEKRYQLKRRRRTHCGQQHQMAAD